MEVEKDGSSFAKRLFSASMVGELECGRRTAELSFFQTRARLRQSSGWVDGGGFQI